MNLLSAGALVIVGACAAVAISAAPATAAAAPLTKSQLSHASLRISDVPPSFSSNPSRSFSYTDGAATRAFEMCVDKDGLKVLGPKPLQHANSSVNLAQTGSGNDITADLAVSSDIYTYASARKADAKWSKLRKATKRCAPVIDKPMDFKGAQVDAHVEQTLKKLQAKNGVKGFTLAQDVAIVVGGGGSDDLDVYVGGYTAYRKCGSAIVRVQFANYTQVSEAASAMQKSWKKFTRTESLTIANRIRALR